MKTAILTFQDHPLLTEDDRLILNALKKRGLDPHPVIWDQTKSWPYDLVLLRAAWDYVDNKHQLLLETLSEIEAQKKPLFNTRSMIEWNYNKLYMRDLTEKGLPIAPTVWIVPTELFKLPQIMEEQKWEEIVIKPSISNRGINTFRLDRKKSELLYKIAALGPLAWESQPFLLVQPYFKEIAEEGEYSLIYFNKTFSHAVRKKPEPLGLIVECVEPLSPSPELIKKGDEWLKSVPFNPLYLRLDVIPYEGDYYIQEIEVMGPVLFFESDPQSPERFAQALMERL